MRIYLDNCCFNRPYDDQSHLGIRLESDAKLYISRTGYAMEILSLPGRMSSNMKTH